MDIQTVLGSEADDPLHYRCTKISREALLEPDPDWIERIYKETDRNNRVLGSLAT